MQVLVLKVSASLLHIHWETKGLFASENLFISFNGQPSAEVTLGLVNCYLC